MINDSQAATLVGSTPDSSPDKDPPPAGGSVSTGSVRLQTSTGKGSADDGTHVKFDSSKHFAGLKPQPTCGWCC